MPTFKNPLELAELLKLDRENRKNTLNKRINYKGNYENYITGGSRALDNQARLYDTNEVANAIATDPRGGWEGEPWIHGTTDRYANPINDENHRFTPSTKRARRLQDIYFGSPQGMSDYIIDKIRKYEGKK